jgi:peptide/nickel transport system substrate-binding protein
MQSPVEGSSKQARTRRVSRRGFLKLAGGTGSLMLLAACGGGAPAAPAATEAPLVPRAVPTMAPAQSAPTAAAPAAAAPTAAPKPQATAAPAVAQAGAKGKFTYAFHTAIAPAWLDPQEAPPQVTPYNFAYALHDALIKPMPGKDFAPSLAESYEVAPDFKSATFKLRQGVKFHDGSPVTGEDVKFTYENYRGASAAVLKAKLDRIDLPDDRTVKFFFKEPFVDFLILYGSPASGAAWIVPKAHYQKVGKDGFKTAPIGAGPYRFVRQAAGSEMEFEAFPEYWRKSPSVKTLVARGVPEAATRLAMLKTGEIDTMYSVPGDLLDVIRKEPGLRLTAPLGGSVWLELMSLDRPDHPFKDIRVRQAVSLALDRKAINDAELGGLSPVEGNWVPAEWPGALQRPVPPTDLAKAKELMAQAGVPDGFDVSAITPLPPFYSWGERVGSQLRGIGIRTQVNTMERAPFYERLAPGPERLKGMVIQFSGAPGDAGARIRENAVCKGAFSGLCVPEVEDKMAAHDASTDLQQRKKILDEVQAYLLDQYLLIPLVRNVFTIAAGPKLANPKIEDIIGSIPQYIWIGPWEDLQIKDG